MLSKLKARLGNRRDTEHEQGLIRLLIGFLVLLYCFSPLSYGPHSNPDTIVKVQGMISLFVTFSVLNLAVIVAYPEISPVRRVIGMCADLGATSYIMALTGYDGLPLFPIYLWVAMGNGFRYGRAYLLGATVVSVFGFSTVVTVHPYWHENAVLASSILIALTVLPMYFAKLLQQLYRAIDRANEANTAKTRFLANMSHELRTPLNGVIGMTDLLIDTELNAEQKSIAGAVQSSAHTLLDLVEDVLDISKIESGKIELDTTDFDLHRLVKDTVYMFRNQSLRKGIAMRSHIASNVPFQLHGDRARLRQVLVNLIGNAVKFTHKGHVDLYVDLLERGKNNVTVRFKVEDTGVGIPESMQSRIFERFTQADQTTTRRYGGSGLGTTIARQLVELMGGRIGLESVVDQGTTFWFEVPLATAQSGDVEHDAMRSLEGLNVVYVGRHPQELTTMARDWQLSVHQAHDLAQGLGLVSAERTGRTSAIVFVDLADFSGTPEMLEESCRRNGASGEVAIVPICANEQDAGLALERYPTVLVKPLEQSEVFNAVHAANADHDSSNNVISLAERYRFRNKGRSGRILVAEDNTVNQQVIEGILKRGGHECTVVGDGETALDMLSEGTQTFDMLVLDMNMPGIGGIDVFKSYRFMNTRDPVPTIILTADATFDALKKCDEAGVDAYLTKPIDARKLLDRVASLLAQKPVANDVPEPEEAEQGASRNRNDLTLTNRNVIKTLREMSSDTGFIAELVTGFSSDGQRLLRDLQAAVEESDFPRFRNSLHALRGSCLELGCERLAAICELGQGIKPPAMRSDAPREIAVQVRRVFTETCTALRLEEQHVSATANH